jgi:hypothetical protein
MGENFAHLSNNSIGLAPMTCAATVL